MADNRKLVNVIRNSDGTMEVRDEISISENGQHLYIVSDNEITDISDMFDLLLTLNRPNN